MSKFLFLIPARGGSKGIPKKNIKKLANKPLICYTIDIARQFAEDADICVSTDDENIINVVENYGLSVPFIRPDYLSTDEAVTYEVILHAIHYYKSIGIIYDIIVLLQPTSPFRLKQHMIEAIGLFNEEIDMVVSVKKAKYTPDYNTFFVDNRNFLEPYSDIKIQRRQNISDYYNYNGSIYIMNVQSLLSKPISDFSKIRMYEMDELYSADIDTPIDFSYCEFLIEKGLINL